MKDNVILEVKNVEKFFYGNKKLFQKDRPVVKAVNDVSFTINEGETFGIVGESGCGKSTLGRTVIRLLNPTSGQVLYKGTDLATLSGEEMRKLRQEIQIIFQDPYASLNPRMTVRELIQAPLDVYSHESEAEKLAKVKNIMAKVGLREEYMSKYPHEFSGGQRQRIVIARALILEPKFIFCDEPVSALDVSVRAQVLNLMKDLQKEELYDNPMHPYTKALLSAIPVPDVDVKHEPMLLEGDIPSPYNPPKGCLFHTRCKFAMECCKTEVPQMRQIGENHCVACHLYDDVK